MEKIRPWQNARASSCAGVLPRVTTNIGAISVSEFVRTGGSWLRLVYIGTQVHSPRSVCEGVAPGCQEAGAVLLWLGPPLVAAIEPPRRLSLSREFWTTHCSFGLGGHRERPCPRNAPSWRQRSFEKRMRARLCVVAPAKSGHKLAFSTSLNCQVVCHGCAIARIPSCRLIV